MTSRPNWANKTDACCCCSTLLPTPKDHTKPDLSKGQLGVWQPSPLDPPQWICADCRDRLERDARRDS